jgi:regulator of sigma E protease
MLLNILLTIISIIGALIVLGIIIMVHEFGHFSIGRACKIKVVEFAVGFGPKIKQWVKNDIIYSVRWLFIGGFTKFYGEDEDTKDKLAFNNQPAGRRALTIAAGPVYNIVFAFLLVILMLCAFGDYVPTVGDVWKGSPADNAGLKVGDRILEMNGVHMDFFLELDSAQRESDGVTMPVTVLRDGKTLSFNIPYKTNLTNNNGEVVSGNLIGINLGQERITFGFFQAIGLSFKWMFLILKETVLAILGLFAGRGTQDVSGVVYVVNVLGQAVRSSFENVLRLGVAISASLAIVNLLPLPALDGGRLVFIAIEKIFKKPVPRNVEGMIHFIGFAALMVLFVFITYQDITRMIGGGS